MKTFESRDLLMHLRNCFGSFLFIETHRRCKSCRPLVCWCLGVRHTTPKNTPHPFNCLIDGSLTGWMAEVRRTLRKMDIKVELKPLVDDQVLDIWMPVSKAVVCPIGPYGYYAGTTHRTAYSKMHQRILELEGHVCIPVPYFEWAELKTDEDKMVYLWSLGRKAAGGRDRQMDVPSETEPAEVEDWQSDLTDTAAAEL